MLFLLVSMLITTTIVFILTLVKLAISDYSWNIFSREEASSYECGFEQHSLSRIPISIRYFLLTLVFLIFDLEVMLLLFTPLDLMLGVNKSFLILVSLMFILLLFLGLIYEWLDGSLDWVM